MDHWELYNFYHKFCEINCGEGIIDEAIEEQASNYLCNSILNFLPFTPQKQELKIYIIDALIRHSEGYFSWSDAEFADDCISEYKRIYNK